MKRALAVGILCSLWMASPALAKRDGDDDQKHKGESCLLVLEREQGDIRVGCGKP